MSTDHEVMFSVKNVPKFKEAGSDNLERVMKYGPKIKDYFQFIRSSGRSLTKSEYEKFIQRAEKLFKPPVGWNFMYHGKDSGTTALDELIKLVREHLKIMVSKNKDYKRKDCLTELLKQLKECQLCIRLLITDTEVNTKDDDSFDERMKKSNFTILAVPKSWNIHKGPNNKWEKVFKGHGGLKKIKMELGVEGVAPRVFFGCSKLESVQFAGTEKELGVGSFQKCSNLKKFRNFPSKFIERNSNERLKLSDKIKGAFDEHIEKAVLNNAKDKLKWVGNKFSPAMFDIIVK